MIGFFLLGTVVDNVLFDYINNKEKIRKMFFYPTEEQKEKMSKAALEVSEKIKQRQDLLIKDAPVLYQQLKQRRDLEMEEYEKKLQAEVDESKRKLEEFEQSQQRKKKNSKESSTLFSNNNESAQLEKLYKELEEQQPSDDVFTQKSAKEKTKKFNESFFEDKHK